MRCLRCGGYRIINNQCKDCGTTFSSPPRVGLLGKVDVFKLAKLLKEKREAEEATRGKSGEQ